MLFFSVFRSCNVILLMFGSGCVHGTRACSKYVWYNRNTEWYASTKWGWRNVSNSWDEYV